MNVDVITKSHEAMEKLVADSVSKSFPKVGDLITGNIVSIGKNEVIIDLPGLTTGVVRGWELEDESGQMSSLKIGEDIQATVLDLENERGMIELSFRVAGHRKAWDNLNSLKSSGEIITTKAIEANKGGLIVNVGKVLGFLPVSQLSGENYPRVEGGNKTKILDKLKEYIGKEFRVKIIDLDEVEEKLIVSEKAINEAKQIAALSGYKVGAELEVKISGLVDFGLFVELPASPNPSQLASDESAASQNQDNPAAAQPGQLASPEAHQGGPASVESSTSIFAKSKTTDQGQSLEGLVHISEVAWQRVDNLSELYKVGDIVKTKIIDITNSKVSLSIKRLLPDPWQDAVKHFKVGQVVKGKVLKLNDFGAFVELDHSIHGLAHISELKAEANSSMLELGSTYDFKIINMEPAAHRLGLSRRVDDDQVRPDPKTVGTGFKPVPTKE